MLFREGTAWREEDKLGPYREDVYMPIQVVPQLIIFEALNLGFFEVPVKRFARGTVITKCF